MRREMDTLKYLRDNHEVAVIVEGRDEFPELDLVFDIKQASALRRTHDCYIRPIYLSMGGVEIRCSLKTILIHTIHHHYRGLEFTRYIVGRPNRITLPVDIKWKTGQTMTNYANKHANWNMRQVELVCYNDLYPRMIMLDSEYLTKNLRFRLGDLQNI